MKPGSTLNSTRPELFISHLTEHDQEEIEKGYYFQHRAGLSD